MTIDEPHQTVFIVKTDQPPALEVFEKVDDAREFARLRSGATVHFLPLRTSLGEARIVVERRVAILRGQIISDKSVEETLFSAGVDFSIPEVDIETYQEDPFHWHVVGLGSDHEKVADGVDREIARIRSRNGISAVTEPVTSADGLRA